MRKRLLQLLVAGILVTLPPLGMDGQQAPVHAAGAGQTHTPSTDETRVVATIRALFDAAERVDLAALDSLYAGDSLTVIEGAGLDRTWKDYRDHHLVPELKEFENFRYRPSEIEPHVDGDAAWAIFRYTLAAVVEGRPVDVVGRGTAILERRGSRWVVRHTHTSGRARRASDSPGK